MTALQDRARELLAAEVEAMNRPITAAAIRKGSKGDYMEVAAIRAILTALEANNAVERDGIKTGWKPIDSVPKDGTIFAVLYRPYNVASNTPKVQLAQWIDLYGDGGHLCAPYDYDNRIYAESWAPVTYVPALTVASETLTAAVEAGDWGDVERAAAEIEAIRADRDAALRECLIWAQEAGEAKGRLEASEKAGVVEDWRERALKAEAALTALEVKSAVDRETIAAVVLRRCQKMDAPDRLKLIGDILALTNPSALPERFEDNPIGKAILNARHRAAVNLTDPQFQGQRGQDWDRGLMHAYELAEALATPIASVGEGK